MAGDYGQRVHLDYYSPWGPVTFLIMAAGLRYVP